MSDDGHFVSLSDEEFLNTAVQLIDSFRAVGLTVRIFGGAAAYFYAMQNPKTAMMAASFARLGEGKPSFADLDLVAYGKEKKGISKLLEEKGYVPDEFINSVLGNRRLLYYHPKASFQMDIFFDNLEFSHNVPFGDRLAQSYPVVSATDLLLQKLQIHDINHKDLIDIALLLHSQPVSKGQESDKIGATYVAKMLSDDWGFWYDAVNNLKKVQAMVAETADNANGRNEDFKLVDSRIKELMAAIDGEPKSSKWEKRSKKGTNKVWYNQVEELVR